MRRETKIIIFAIITIVLNVLAPFLVVKMVKDYNKDSHIYGSPDMNYYEVSTYVKTSDYVYQENLSNVLFEEDSANSCWVYNYHVSNKDFDSTTNNYAIFINDYICSFSELNAKSLTAVHSFDFLDINQKVLGSASLNIRFEFFSSYTNLVIKLTTTDKGYFNSYLDNPGLILTLSKVDSGFVALMKENVSEAPPIEDIPTDVYMVKFFVGSTVYDIKYVALGETLTSIPTDPTRPGYNFDGWSNGSKIVDLSSLEITDDTTLTAVFSEMLVSTETAVAVSFNNDLTSIYGNDVWTDGTNTYYSHASKQYVWDADNFRWNNKEWNGLTEFYGKYVWTNGTNMYYSAGIGKHYLLNEATSTWTETYWSFDDINYGSSNFYGNQIFNIDDTTYLGVEKTSGLSTTYYYFYLDGRKWIFTRIFSDSSFGYSDLDPTKVWSLGTHTYYSSKYELTTSGYTEKTWSGLTSFDSEYVWTNGTYAYYSSGTSQYALYSNDTWGEITWENLASFDGNYIWTVGIEIYYSYSGQHYLLLVPQIRKVDADILTDNVTLVNYTGVYSIDDTDVICRPGAVITVSVPVTASILSTTNCSVNLVSQSDTTAVYDITIGAELSIAKINWVFSDVVIEGNEATFTLDSSNGRFVEEKGGNCLYNAISVDEDELVLMSKVSDANVNKTVKITVTNYYGETYEKTYLADEIIEVIESEDISFSLATYFLSDLGVSFRFDQKFGGIGIYLYLGSNDNWSTVATDFTNGTLNPTLTIQFVY